MKKILLFLISMFSLVIFAHEPLLMVEDQKNAYILISGGYSNGESAAGTPIYILKDKLYNGAEETFDDKLVIFKGALNEKGELLLPKPKTSKYIVIFDGGVGHITNEKGPKLTKEEAALWEEAMKKDTILGSWKDKMLDLIK